MRNHGHFCTKTFVIRERLTLDKGVSLAQSVEIEEKGAKDLKSPVENNAELYKLTRRAMSGSENKSREAKYKYPLGCFRCGGRHLATNCHFISEVCHSFGKQGQHQANTQTGRILNLAPAMKKFVN